MPSLATSLTTVLDRIVDDLVDVIAKDGLVALKRVLDEAGFGDSPYLKDYEVYAHVYGDTVAFEIVLDFDSVVSDDEAARRVLDEAARRADEESDNADEDQPSATYGMGPSGPRRVTPTNAKRDARRPARNARRPARDARKNAVDRLVEKEVANITPRSARVTRDGRLSVALQRSTKRVNDELVLPQGEFQGIIGKFMKELSSVIGATFASELSQIISDYADG